MYIPLYTHILFIPYLLREIYNPFMYINFPFMNVVEMNYQCHGGEAALQLYSNTILSLFPLLEECLLPWLRTEKQTLNQRYVIHSYYQRNISLQNFQSSIFISNFIYSFTGTFITLEWLAHLILFFIYFFLTPGYKHHVIRYIFLIFINPEIVRIIPHESAALGVLQTMRY